MVVRLLLLALCVSSLLGCADISLQTVDTQERVLSRSYRVESGPGVRVRSRMDDTTLVLQTTQACQRSSYSEVEITEVREPDEDVTEELIILGLALAPVGTGVGLLVDAPNVHDNDRNSREYNSTGQSGAYAAGGVLVGAGGLIALWPIIELFRIAAAGEETTRTTERRDEVVDPNVRCAGPSRPKSVAVQLRVGGQTIYSGRTQSNGLFQLDLTTLPTNKLRSAISLEVLVAGQTVGEIDLLPVLERQEEKLREADEELWQRVSQAPCERIGGGPGGGADDGGCRSRRLYLQRFPNGLHAQQARDDLTRAAKNTQELQIAEEQPDPATTKAVEQAKKIREAQFKACEKQCERSCQKNEACFVTCVEEGCER